MTEKRYDQTANEKGMVLILALFSLSLLISSILICVFLMGEELNQDARYQENRERIQKVRRAFLGKMADVPRGTEMNNCGGLISEYGIRFLTHNTAPEWVLKKPENAVKWHYDKERHFWAGWRGPYYIPPLGEDNLKDEEGNLAIIDGWGTLIHLHIPCVSLRIFSKGSDGQPTDFGTDYSRDIDTVRSTATSRVKIIVNNKTDYGANLMVEVIYPKLGEVQAACSVPRIINAHTSYTFLIEGLPVTVGVRKIAVLDVNTHEIKASKAFCIWFSHDEVAAEAEIDYEG